MKYILMFFLLFSLSISLIGCDKKDSKELEMDVKDYNAEVSYLTQIRGDSTIVYCDSSKNDSIYFSQKTTVIPQKGKTVLSEELTEILTNNSSEDNLYYVEIQIYKEGKNLIENKTNEEIQNILNSCGIENALLNEKSVNKASYELSLSKECQAIEETVINQAYIYTYCTEKVIRNIGNKDYGIYIKLSSI